MVSIRDLEEKIECFGVRLGCCFTGDVLQRPGDVVSDVNGLQRLDSIAGFRAYVCCDEQRLNVNGRVLSDCLLGQFGQQEAVVPTRRGAADSIKETFSKTLEHSTVC